MPHGCVFGLGSGQQRVELPDPTPGPGKVAVRVRAASLNFRDTVVLRGGYPRNDRLPTVPLSDAAGEVAAVGEGVDGWSVGDRVMPNFLRDWAGGAATEEVLHTSLGGGVGGVLCETFLANADTLVRIPDHLSFAQAATLPCAALTAWNALTAAGTKAGDAVLLLGTGGVSVFGLQFAKAMGATAIITSSSDEKLERAEALWADHTVNYERHPEWHENVREITGGRGVDHVLDVGGPGTLDRSMQSARVGGTVSLIGVMTGGQPNMILPVLGALTVRGIYVGSAEMFRDMNRAIAAHRIEPVVDRTFAFDEAADAYRHLMGQGHFGKIVVEVQ